MDTPRPITRFENSSVGVIPATVFVLGDGVDVVYGLLCSRGVGWSAGSQPT